MIGHIRRLYSHVVDKRYAVCGICPAALRVGLPRNVADKGREVIRNIEQAGWRFVRNIA